MTHHTPTSQPDEPATSCTAAGDDHPTHQPRTAPAFRPDPDLIVNVEGDEKHQQRAVEAARAAVERADRAELASEHPVCSADACGCKACRMHRDVAYWRSRAQVRLAELRVLGPRFDGLERVVEQVRALYESLARDARSNAANASQAGEINHGLWLAECEARRAVYGVVLRDLDAILASVDAPAPDEADEHPCPGCDDMTIKRVCHNCWGTTDDPEFARTAAPAVPAEAGEAHSPRYMVSELLNRWLADQMDRAEKHHAACMGNGHHPEDRCETWYALANTLTAMHARTWNLAGDVLAAVSPVPEADETLGRDDLDDGQREVDRRIGAAVAAAVSPVPAEPDSEALERAIYARLRGTSITNDAGWVTDAVLAVLREQGVTK